MCETLHKQHETIEEAAEQTLHNLSTVQDRVAVLEARWGSGMRANAIVALRASQELLEGARAELLELYTLVTD